MPNLLANIDNNVSLQFLVDMSTKALVLDSLSQAVQAHMDSNLAEYKAGSLSVSFNTSTASEKINLIVNFEYSHNGEHLGCFCM